VNRDPIGEVGGNNLYQMVLNDLINASDTLGLKCSDCKDGANELADDYGDMCCPEKIQMDAKGKRNCRVATIGEKDRGGGGGGGGCKDSQGSKLCLLDAAVNLGLGFIPGYGLLAGVTGLDLNFFQDNAALEPNVAGVSGVVADRGKSLIDAAYRARGGNLSLNICNNMAGRNGLGQVTRAARSNLSVLKTFGKSLGILGIGFAAWEFADDIKACRDTYCN
jgi:hypothetical protein